MKLQSISPHDQSIIGEVDITPPEEITKMVAKAKAAFPAWKNTPITKRIDYIKKYKQLVLDHQAEIAKLVTLEMGKPVGQSQDEVPWELGYVDYYINFGASDLADETVLKNEKEHFRVVYEPYGVCVVIPPWNFPLSMFNSGVLPALIAGNTVVVKPTEYATLSQKLCYELLVQTGLPDGVLNIIYGGKDTGKQLVDSDINLVWFTGSTKAGLDISAKCGTKFIKCILEMGGSSPAIVFADANLDHAIDQLYYARFLNTGQVCSAVKRLFVEKSIFDQFVDLYKIRVSQAKMGTDVGPLVNTLQLALLKSQVQDAVSKGATVVLGGAQPAEPEFQKGNYYLPTLLTGVKPDMRVMTEEVFGPVLPIVQFQTEDEVVQLANATEYGLSAEIYTSDIAKAERLAKLINAGVVAINTDNFFKPPIPFGGYKKSGQGREYGTIGMREFCQIKTVGVYQP